jgi:hypothetical protein
MSGHAYSLLAATAVGAAVGAIVTCLILKFDRRNPPDDLNGTFAPCQCATFFERWRRHHRSESDGAVNSDETIMIVVAEDGFIETFAELARRA